MKYKIVLTLYRKIRVYYYLKIRIVSTSIIFSGYMFTANVDVFIYLFIAVKVDKPVFLNFIFLHLLLYICGDFHIQRNIEKHYSDI